MLFVCHPKFSISIIFSFSWGHFNSQEKLKTMLMQIFEVTNKEHYGMLWYFWSGQFLISQESHPVIVYYYLFSDVLSSSISIILQMVLVVIIFASFVLFCFFLTVLVYSLSFSFRKITFGFRSTTYTSITPMRFNAFVWRWLLFLSFWPRVHAKTIKSLPPFLSTKQRSSYTYAQTDSIKYDSMRLRRFWEITRKTSVSTKHIYVWVPSQKNRLEQTVEAFCW